MAATRPPFHQYSPPEPFTRVCRVRSSERRLVHEGVVPEAAIMGGAETRPGEGRQNRYVLRQEQGSARIGTLITNRPRPCRDRAARARLVHKSRPGRIPPARVRIAGRREVCPGGDELVGERFLCRAQGRRLARAL